MTIQEAIKSGKEFKREGFDVWLRVLEDNSFETSKGLDAEIWADAILATDWITKETEINK